MIVQSETSNVSFEAYAFTYDKTWISSKDMKFSVGIKPQILMIANRIKYA